MDISTGCNRNLQDEHIALAIIGNISHDRVWYGVEQKASFLGGAGLNVALAAAYSGIRPQLISTIGESDHQILKTLEPFISTISIAALKGDSCQFEMHYSVQGVLESLSCRFGVATYLDLHTLSLNISAHHIHICCRTPLHPWLILSRLVHVRASFSLDFIVSSASQQMLRCKDWIKYASCVFVNQQEYEVLKELCSLRQIQMLVVTNGSGPIHIFYSGTEIFSMNVSEQPFYDVTGAGDTFIGAFLAFHVLGKESLDSATRKAVAAAQASLQGPGIWGLYS